MDRRRCQEVFDVFIVDGSDLVKTSHLIYMLRALGLNPRGRQGTYVKGQTDMDLEAFIKVADRCYEEEYTMENLLDSFKLCDKEDTGTISMGEMRYLMTKLGNNITEAEFNVILEDAKISPHQKTINYKNFVDFLVNKPAAF